LQNINEKDHFEVFDLAALDEQDQMNDEENLLD
jgi:hypothetical protein